MIKKHVLLAILLAGLANLFVTNLASAAGILGFQPGDRSKEENAMWMEKGKDHIQTAIKELKEGNNEQSIKNGYAGMADLREINSEGLGAKRGRVIRHIRGGISDTKKGQLEKASLHYQEALVKIEDLKKGGLNFTHDSFLGIGDNLKKDSWSTY